MLTRQQRSAYFCVLSVLFLATVFSFAPSNAIAQDQEQRSSFAASIAKQLILDPTTYAPAVISADATFRDWQTSQPFFRNGFMEHNPRFTISGLPDDVPVTYGEGNRRILSDTFDTLGKSLANNFAGRMFERMLMERYPDHRNLVRTIGWIERASFSAYLSYLQSVEHYRQAEANAVRARQLGYR